MTSHSGVAPDRSIRLGDEAVEVVDCEDEFSAAGRSAHFARCSRSTTLRAEGLRRTCLTSALRIFPTEEAVAREFEVEKVCKISATYTISGSFDYVARKVHELLAPQRTKNVRRGSRTSLRMTVLG